MDPAASSRCSGDELMRCQRSTPVKGSRPKRCESKATMFVRAYGGKSWSGYFCSKHVVVIVKVRMRMIRKYRQNVVVRPITEWDRKRYKRQKEGRQ